MRNAQEWTWLRRSPETTGPWAALYVAISNSATASCGPACRPGSSSRARLLSTGWAQLPGFYIPEVLDVCPSWIQQEPRTEEPRGDGGAPSDPGVSACVSVSVCLCLCRVHAPPPQLLSSSKLTVVEERTGDQNDDAESQSRPAGKPRSGGAVRLLLELSDLLKHVPRDLEGLLDDGGGHGQRRRHLPIEVRRLARPRPRVLLGPVHLHRGPRAVVGAAAARPRVGWTVAVAAC